MSDSLYAVVAGTVADRLRGTPVIARVERWFGGTVLIGLGVAAALVAPHRSQLVAPPALRSSRCRLAGGAPIASTPARPAPASKLPRHVAGHADRVPLLQLDDLVVDLTRRCR